MKKATEIQSYSRLIHSHVRHKWHTPELKEWWYLKYRSALRRKVVRLFHEQDGLCYFCKKPTFLGEDDKGEMSARRMATADHIIPQSKGGTDRLSNLVMACQACNSLRGDMKFEKFLRLRQNPELWSAYCKTRARIKNANSQQRSKSRKVKRAHKGIELVWKLAILLYLKPEWIPVAKEIELEFKRRREVVESHRRRKLEKSMVDPVDIR